MEEIEDFGEEIVVCVSTKAEREGAMIFCGCSVSSGNLLLLDVWTIYVAIYSTFVRRFEGEGSKRSSAEVFFEEVFLFC